MAREAEEERRRRAQQRPRDPLGNNYDPHNYVYVFNEAQEAFAKHAR